MWLMRSAAERESGPVGRFCGPDLNHVRPARLYCFIFDLVPTHQIPQRFMLAVPVGMLFVIKLDRL